MAIAGPTTDHEEIRRWAVVHAAVPVEVLPRIVDSVPTLIRLMIAAQVGDRSGVQEIGWEEFFLKFDALGLTFVYSDDSSGDNEILQIEEKSPYRHPVYRTANFEN